MPHDTDELDGPLNWGAAFLGWILPGFGHIFLGHLRRGLLAMCGILGLFFGGIVIGGVDCVDRREDPLWFYAQAAAGPVAFAADWANSALLKTGIVGELVESPPARPGNPPPLVSTFKSVTVASEIGTLYCFLAGLMNLVVILDALKRPRHLPDPSTAGGK